MAIDCNVCNTTNAKGLDKKASFFSVLLVILIPKCSICVMAYSSAIAVCGGESLYMNSNNWVSFIPLLLSGLIIALIIKNWKGSKSIFAIVLGLIGFSMVLLSHQLILSSVFYDLGSIFLLLSVGLNSNLPHVLAFLQSRIRKERKVHA